MKKLYIFFVNNIIGRIEFTSLKYLFTGRYFDLTREDVNFLCNCLQSDRYFGLLRRKVHLTTYLISIGHFILTGKFGYWSHIWANVEDDEADQLSIDIIEAVGKGVIVSPFWDVLNCDAICLLKPKYINDEQWEKVAKEIRGFVGKKYDSFFNINNPDELSCEELLYWGIMSVDDKALPGLNRLIKKYGNFTPDMIYSCGDFMICAEIRR